MSIKSKILTRAAVSLISILIFIPTSYASSWIFIINDFNSRWFFLGAIGAFLLAGVTLFFVAISIAVWFIDIDD